MKEINLETKIHELRKLYMSPLPSTRNGALYNAFSYPTKISPEAIALFIACHTDINSVILDPFAGSGTTGLATKLCDVPTQAMLDTAAELGLQPKWGKRKAILYELSTVGSLVSSVMCNPPNSAEFAAIANQLINDVEDEIGNLYVVKDNEGKKGTIRYIIWSEILLCPVCKNENTFWETAVHENPLKIAEVFECKYCHHNAPVNKAEKATEEIYDEVLKKTHTVKKRIPVKLYGRTGKKNWSRLTTKADIDNCLKLFSEYSLERFPEYQINWGVLYRRGYHQGITHLHHFYTKRNAIIFSRLWNKIQQYPKQFHKALQMLLLSYNSSHATLMTRVVVKQKSKDFVITGSQSGVLYVSNLPIEKNLIDGIRRKISVLKQAFQQVEISQSTVTVFNSSSTFINLPDNSIDYIFTDPPFGDYIPYAEINQINEAWLGKLSNQNEEVVVNNSQGKGINEYMELMCAVFDELNRVLKRNGLMSLVFHSAKAEIWQSLVSSYQRAGFQVLASSILDKFQASFKQTISSIKVQGDPLLLLAKSEELITSDKSFNISNKCIFKDVVNYAFQTYKSIEEQKPERLFSRYVNACLESDTPVAYDASEFYILLKHEFPHYQYS